MSIFHLIHNHRIDSHWLSWHKKPVLGIFLSHILLRRRLLPTGSRSPRQAAPHPAAAAAAMAFEKIKVANPIVEMDG
jgi:hypothetical protein